MCLYHPVLSSADATADEKLVATLLKISDLEELLEKAGVKVGKFADAYSTLHPDFRARSAGGIAAAFVEVKSLLLSKARTLNAKYPDPKDILQLQALEKEGLELIRAFLNGELTCEESCGCMEMKNDEKKGESPSSCCH